MTRVISRRKVKVAIVALLVVFLVSVMAGCSKAEPQYDLVKNEGDYKDTVFENMQYLADNYPDRTMGTEGELNTAKYLASRLSSFGYTSEYSCDEGEGLQRFRVSNTRYDGSTVSDINVYNVIFTKKAWNSSKGVILLSAQYDNLYQEKRGDETWKADGSYESGSGTATLLALAEIMSTIDCSYDVTFAFFTGGCYGWEGASQYVDSLKNSDFENIKLNINFSMLGGGDILYLYTGETVSDFGEYLRSASNGLMSNPKDKNVAPWSMEADSKYPYTHIGMMGNQYFLMNRNVPTANFTAHNWSCNDNPFLTEMQGKGNVYHTSDDTLSNMIERKGEDDIKAMLNDVVNTVLTALSESNAVERDGALATAREQIASKGQGAQQSSMATVAIKLITVAIFFGIALTVRNYVRKNRRLYVKEKPVEEEQIKPFDFDTYPKNEEKRDGDDSENFDGDDNSKPPYDPFV